MNSYVSDSVFVSRDGTKQIVSLPLLTLESNERQTLIGEIPHHVAKLEWGQGDKEIHRKVCEIRKASSGRDVEIKIWSIN